MELINTATFRPTVSQNPFYQRNLIDFNDIQRNSKFKKINLIVKNNANAEVVYNFIIFQKTAK